MQEHIGDPELGLGPGSAPNAVGAWQPHHALPSLAEGSSLDPADDHSRGGGEPELARRWVEMLREASVTSLGTAGSADSGGGLGSGGSR